MWLVGGLSCTGVVNLTFWAPEAEPPLVVEVEWLPSSSVLHAVNAGCFFLDGSSSLFFEGMRLVRREEKPGMLRFS